jgi:hypothetical protein
MESLTDTTVVSPHASRTLSFRLVEEIVRAPKGAVPAWHER